MKLSCQIVQDLLPLLQDGVCSQDSKNAVLEHLEMCACCRKLNDDMGDLCETELISCEKPNDLVLWKGLRKIRRRWVLSVIAVLMIFPTILLGLMIRNERNEEGICFSNLDELSACRRYLSALADEDYDTAAECVDFSNYYLEIEEALAMRPGDYMRSYEALRIGNESYMASLGTVQKYLSEADFWNAALRSCDEQIPIPLKVWEQILPKPSVQNGICYLPYETKWGTFMIVDTMYETLVRQKEPALFEYFAIMPNEMHAELLPQMEAQAQRYFENTQSRLAAVKGMDTAAFENYMRLYYAERIGSNLKIGDADYCDAFYASDCWYIGYEAEVIAEGQRERVRFTFHAKDGKLLSVTVQCVEAVPDMEHLFESFSPRLA